VIHIRRPETALKNMKWTFTIMDNDLPAKQLPSTADLGPIHHFLSCMPDWMNINAEGLNLALESLPIPLKGPIPPGISLQEAIQVDHRHLAQYTQKMNTRT
jgi:hypothetical protein